VTKNYHKNKILGKISISIWFVHTTLHLYRLYHDMN